MVWAAAMLFDKEPEEIMQLLGHDGLGGVHMQELQKIALESGYSLVPFEPEPCLVDSVIDCWDFEPWLEHPGLMLGKTSKGNNHCVAWDGLEVYDPAISPDFVGYHTFYAKIKNL